MVENRKRTTISVSRQTREALSQSKHPGQSYDGLIQELLKLWQASFKQAAGVSGLSHGNKKNEK